ncbi:hypothetical protein HK405_011212 [Cladochytrium tenue]|nr:hypothetical protein HK405_011212 [Cladochytrium tenue]
MNCHPEHLRNRRRCPRCPTNITTTTITTTTAAASISSSSSLARDKLAACLHVARRFLPREHLAWLMRCLADDIDGLDFHLDERSTVSGGEAVLTLNGSVFVIDIKVDSAGSVTTLSLALASDVESDRSAEQLLASMLRELDLDRFKTALKALVLLDRLSSPGLDLFHVMRAARADLERISALEREAAAVDSGASPPIDPIAVVLREGHGLVFPSLLSVGVTLVFWVNYDRVAAFKRAVDEGRVREELADGSVWAATLVVAEGGLSAFIPKDFPSFIVDDDIGLFETTTGPIFGSSLKYASLQPPSYPSINASFCLEFESPVPICGAVLDALRAVVDQGATFAPQETDLLDAVMEAASRGQPVPYSRDPILADVSIPHLASILPVLKVLRRQLTFNDLLLSCVAPFSPAKLEAPLSTTAAALPESSHSGTALQAVAVIDGWAPANSLSGRLLVLAAPGAAAARELPFRVLLDDDNVPFLLLDDLSADPPLDVDRANAALRDFMSLPRALEAGLLDDGTAMIP